MAIPIPIQKEWTHFLNAVTGHHLAIINKSSKIKRLKNVWCPIFLPWWNQIIKLNFIMKEEMIFFFNISIVCFVAKWREPCSEGWWEFTSPACPMSVPSIQISAWTTDLTEFSVTLLSVYWFLCQCGCCVCSAFMENVVERGEVAHSRWRVMGHTCAHTPYVIHLSLLQLPPKATSLTPSLPTKNLHFLFPPFWASKFLSLLTPKEEIQNSS